MSDQTIPNEAAMRHRFQELQAQLAEAKAENKRLRAALGAAVDGLLSGGCAYCPQNTTRALDIVYRHVPEMSDQVAADMKARKEK